MTLNPFQLQSLYQHIASLYLSHTENDTFGNEKLAISQVKYAVKNEEPIGCTPCKGAK